MSTPIKVSDGVLIATLIVVAWLHLGTLLLAVVLNYVRVEMSKIEVPPAST